MLLDQRVPYPFHITRPFRLHPTRPDLATLYMQSASGGVYAADDLAVTLTVEANAAVHLTTQAATIVHDCRGQLARVTTIARVTWGGFLALLPDPLVLFPGAEIVTMTDVTLHPQGRAILCDAFAQHDPRGEGRPFRRCHSTMIVRDADGRELLNDRGGIDGDALAGAAVLGPWRAWGMLLVLGPSGLLPAPSALEAAAEAAGCLAGAAAAPAGIGLAVRLLGPDGGTLGRCIAGLAATAAEALAGCRLSGRGK